MAKILATTNCRGGDGKREITGLKIADVAQFTPAYDFVNADFAARR